jgi:hypothetical protein
MTAIGPTVKQQFRGRGAFLVPYTLIAQGLLT